MLSTFWGPSERGVPPAGAVLPDALVSLPTSSCWRHGRRGKTRSSSRTRSSLSTSSRTSTSPKTPSSERSRTNRTRSSPAPVGMTTKCFTRSFGARIRASSAATTATARLRTRCCRSADDAATTSARPRSRSLPKTALRKRSRRSLRPLARDPEAERVTAVASTSPKTGVRYIEEFLQGARRADQAATRSACSWNPEGRLPSDPHPRARTELPQRRRRSGAVTGGNPQVRARPGEAELRLLEVAGLQLHGDLAGPELQHAEDSQLRRGRAGGRDGLASRGDRPRQEAVRDRT